MNIYKAGTTYVVQIGNITILASNRLEAMRAASAAAAATTLKEKDDMGFGVSRKR